MLCIHFRLSIKNTLSVNGKGSVYSSNVDDTDFSLFPSNVT